MKIYQFRFIARLRGNQAAAQQTFDFLGAIPTESKSAKHGSRETAGFWGCVYREAGTGDCSEADA